MTSARPALAAVLVLSVTACSVPDSIERRGNFRVEYYRTDAIGHTSIRRALYHIDGSSTTLVTDAAVSFAIGLRDQDRILYDTCQVDSGCTLMYFDGHTGMSHVVGRGLKVSFAALDDIDQWSWNGRYVALGDQYELVVVNLETGTSMRPADTLRLSEPYYPDRWQSREVRWGAWSPDGDHASVFVFSPHGPGLPVPEWDQELYALDAMTGALTMIATHTGTAGIRGEGGVWRADDLRWDGAALQPPR